MTTVLPPRRPVVLKTSRDTLALLAAATGLTLAIAYSVHSRPTPPPPSEAPAGEWAGRLAGLESATPPGAAPAEPLSSAALTVPKAAMALPVAPRPAGPLKPRACDVAPCAPAKAGAASTPGPSHHPAIAARPRPAQEASLMSQLNPLNHLPDMVKRPFASAGDAIAGWVRRF